MRRSPLTSDIITNIIVNVAAPITITIRIRIRIAPGNSGRSGCVWF